jgi:hypothetical protein
VVETLFLPYHNITNIQKTIMKVTNKMQLCFFLCRCDPTRVMASFLRFLDHTQRRTIVGRTPLDE